MPISEAYIPIYRFQRTIVVTSVILSIMVTLLAMALARVFSQPIQTLIGRIRRVDEGEKNLPVTLEGNDEYSQLSQEIQSLIDHNQTHLEASEAQRDRAQTLFEHFLPRAGIKLLRMSDSDRSTMHATEAIENVSVVVFDLGGMRGSFGRDGLEAYVERLNEVVQLIDGACEKHGLDKVYTVGRRYTAISGQSTPHIDHEQKAFNFIVECFESISRFDSEHGLVMDLRAGMADGGVVSGIIGRTKLSFDVWGEPVRQAHLLVGRAQAGELRVAAELIERLPETYTYEMEASGEDSPGAIFQLGNKRKVTNG